MKKSVLFIQIILLAIILLSFNMKSFGQNIVLNDSVKIEENTIKFFIDDKEPVFVVVEEMPEFPGGIKALQDYIYKHLRIPEKSREIEGKVYVRFVVNKSGKVDKIQIARGLDSLLDAEAIRVVKLLPNWKSGKQRGKPVNVLYNIPINFSLRD